MCFSFSCVDLYTKILQTKPSIQFVHKSVCFLYTGCTTSKNWFTGSNPELKELKEPVLLSPTDTLNL